MQQADSRGNSGNVKAAEPATTRRAASKPVRPKASTAVVSRQRQTPGEADRRQAAADFLVGIGLTQSRAAWALRRWSQLGDLTPAELQACVSAIAAAFGGGLSAAALARRLHAEPKLLTRTPDSIAASHGRLAVIGLTSKEAAKVLAVQTALLLASAKQLHSTTCSLCSHFDLSPEQLHTVITGHPPCLTLSEADMESPSSRLGGVIASITRRAHVKAKREGGRPSTVVAKRRACKVGLASFR